MGDHVCVMCAAFQPVKQGDMTTSYNLKIDMQYEAYQLKKKHH